MVTKAKKRTGEVLFSKYTPGSAIEKVITMSREDVLFEVRESKLKGRGGAGFPTATKWMLTAAAQAEKKYIICNADEGEPGTFKDRVLLLEYPELVFEGMVVAAYAIGAKYGIVYLRDEYSYMVKSLNDFLAGMKKEKLLGNSILGKEGFDFDIQIFLGAGAYVCGEETALIESLEGQRGEPRNRPPYPVNTGFKGFPTVVNNVETLASVAHIIVKGGEWFRTHGTDKSTGSKLFSVSGDCAKPGVYELPWGISIKELLKIVGAEKTKAVQVGGASGVCIPASQFNRKLSYEDAATGGSIIIFNESRNMLHVMKNFLEFFMEESCGQCTPCRIGNRILLEAANKLAKKDFTFAYLHSIKELCRTMQVASKCGLGQTSPNAFLSILENFSDDIYGHKNKNGVNHVR